MMSTNEIFERLLPSVQEIFGDRDDFTLDSSFTSLNIDSIKFTELIVICEELFDFEVIDSELEIFQYQTISDFINMLQSAMERYEL